MREEEFNTKIYSVQDKRNTQDTKIQQISLINADILKKLAETDLQIETMAVSFKDVNKDIKKIKKNKIDEKVF